MSSFKDYTIYEGINPQKNSRVIIIIKFPMIYPKKNEVVYRKGFEWEEIKDEIIYDTYLDMLKLRDRFLLTNINRKFKEEETPYVFQREVLE